MNHLWSTDDRNQPLSLTLALTLITLITLITLTLTWSQPAAGWCGATGERGAEACA